MKRNYGICACTILFGAVFLQTVSSSVINREGRELTKEQDKLGNKPGAEIPKAYETNLFRILEVMTAQNEQAAPRQATGVVIDVPAAVLPQVAQLLDSIFRERLNITKLDGLVPIIVRKGIAQLLRGDHVELEPTTQRSSNTKKTDEFKEPSTSIMPISTSTIATTTEKWRYMVRPRPTKVPPLDDEIESYERNIMASFDQTERW